MKITDIRADTLSIGPTIVRVFTDEGVVGLSEIGWHDPAMFRPHLERVIKPMLVGEDPLRPERHWERLYHGTHDRPYPTPAWYVGRHRHRALGHRGQGRRAAAPRDPGWRRADAPSRCTGARAAAATGRRSRCWRRCAPAWTGAIGSFKIRMDWGPLRIDADPAKDLAMVRLCRELAAGRHVAGLRRQPWLQREHGHPPGPAPRGAGHRPLRGAAARPTTGPACARSPQALDVPGLDRRERARPLGASATCSRSATRTSSSPTSSIAGGITEVRRIFELAAVVRQAGDAPQPGDGHPAGGVDPAVRHGPDRGAAPRAVHRVRARRPRAAGGAAGPVTCCRHDGALIALSDEPGLGLGTRRAGAGPAHHALKDLLVVRQAGILEKRLLTLASCIGHTRPPGVCPRGRFGTEEVPGGAARRYEGRWRRPARGPAGGVGPVGGDARRDHRARLARSRRRVPARSTRWPAPAQTVRIALVDGERDELGLRDKEAEIEAATGIDIQLDDDGARRPRRVDRPEPAGARVGVRHRPRPRLHGRRDRRRGPARGAARRTSTTRRRPRPTTTSRTSRPGQLEYTGYFDVETRRVRRRHAVPHPGHPQRLGACCSTARTCWRRGRLDVPTTWAEYLAAAEAADHRRRRRQRHGRRQRPISRLPGRLVHPLHHDGRPAHQRQQGRQDAAHQPRQPGGGRGAPEHDRPAALLARRRSPSYGFTEALDALRDRQGRDVADVGDDRRRALRPRLRRSRTRSPSRRCRPTTATRAASAAAGAWASPRTCPRSTRTAPGMLLTLDHLEGRSRSTRS